MCRSLINDDHRFYPARRKNTFSFKSRLQSFFWRQQLFCFKTVYHDVIMPNLRASKLRSQLTR